MENWIGLAVLRVDTQAMHVTERHVRLRVGEVDNAVYLR
jgi:hypothetical protein